MIDFTKMELTLEQEFFVRQLRAHFDDAKATIVTDADKEAYIGVLEEIITDLTFQNCVFKNLAASAVI